MTDVAVTNGTIRQLQQMVRETPVINGFSYSFCRLLLDHIVSYTDQIFITPNGYQQWYEADDEPEFRDLRYEVHGKLTLNDDIVVAGRLLAQQLNSLDWTMDWHTYEIDPTSMQILCQYASKFLSIFETEDMARE